MISKSIGFQTTVPTTEAVQIKSIPDFSYDKIKTSSDSREVRDQYLKTYIMRGETSYVKDGIVRQSVDKLSELFSSFSLEGDPVLVGYLQARFNMMSIQSGESWQGLLSKIVTEYFKVGNAFILKNRGNGAMEGRRPLYKNRPYSISRYTVVSPERFNPFMNNEGIFCGWEVEVGRSDKLSLVLPNAKRLDPEKALMNISVLPPPEKKNIILDGADISHICYKQQPDSKWGLGVTLSGLEDVALLRTIEQTVFTMLRKFSMPMIHHKITRPQNPLQGAQQEINMAMNLYRSMGPDGVIVTGGNAEIKSVGAESHALRTEGYLDYFLNRAIVGIGMNPFILGLQSGGIGNVESAKDLLMMKIRFCQAELAREIEFAIFYELLWEGGYDPYTNEDHRVKLVFDDIDEDRMIKMQNHYADLYTKNSIGQTELRQRIGLKGSAKDMYVNTVDIPKIKAQGEVKQDLAEKQAALRPKPAAASKPAKKKPAKKKSIKEFVDEMTPILPGKKSEVPLFVAILENMGYDSDVLSDLFNNIELLAEDREALLLFLSGRLYNA